ncbi:P-loop containing nucleoside triphosphate hydrolase protein [Mycena rebaudengoi]|nr:P-loop containing nucleoside triphosphate hydrolase protein [Mycena rebaudengoi]
MTTSTPTAERRKLVVVGDGACGKTCLLTVFCKGTFPEGYVPTCFESWVADVAVENTNQIPDAHVILICFNYQIHFITCRRRYHFFISSIAIAVDQQFAQRIAEVSYFCPRLPIILVGCKTSLRHDPRVIDSLRTKSQTIVGPEAGMSAARRIGVLRYLECSSRTGEGVHDVFQHATRAALAAHQKFDADRKRLRCMILGREHDWGHKALI